MILSYGEMPVFDTGTSKVVCDTLVSCLTWHDCFTCGTFLDAENQSLKMIFKMKNCIIITSAKILKPDK